VSSSETLQLFDAHETLPIMLHMQLMSEKSHQHSDFTLAFTWYYRTVYCHFSLKALFMHFACCQLHYSLFVLWINIFVHT